MRVRQTKICCEFGRALHLPRLCGLGPVTYDPGKKLADPRVPVGVRFADAVLHLQRQDFLSIKAIRFDKPDTIVMQTATIDDIRLGTDYSNEKMLKLMCVLDKLRELRINAKSIDLRFTHVAVVPFPL